MRRVGWRNDSEWRWDNREVDDKTGLVISKKVELRRVAVKH